MEKHYDIMPLLQVTYVLYGLYGIPIPPSTAITLKSILVLFLKSRSFCCIVDREYGYIYLLWTKYKESWSYQLSPHCYAVWSLVFLRLQAPVYEKNKGHQVRNIFFICKIDCVSVLMFESISIEILFFYFFEFDNKNRLPVQSWACGLRNKTQQWHQCFIWWRRPVCHTYDTSSVRQWQGNARGYGHIYIPCCIFGYNFW